MKIMTKAALTVAIRQLPARSKWAQGVKDYAEMLLDNVNNFDEPITEKSCSTEQAIGTTILGQDAHFATTTKSAQNSLRRPNRKERGTEH